MKALLQLYTQVTVSIAGREWSCKLHSSGVDMTSYYSASSIPTYTGFVMDFGSDQQPGSATADNNAFGFNPDIVMVTNAGQITQIIRSLKTQPQSVLITGTARYFVSVNAGEMSGVSTGSLVTITTSTPTSGINISEMMNLMITMMIVMMMMKMMTGMMSQTSA